MGPSHVVGLGYESPIGATHTLLYEVKRSYADHGLTKSLLFTFDAHKVLRGWMFTEADSVESSPESLFYERELDERTMREGIRVKKTTQAEIRSMLGAPQGRGIGYSLPIGLIERWVYSEEEGRASEALEKRTLTLVFSTEDKTVQSWSLDKVNAQRN